MAYYKLLLLCVALAVTNLANAVMDKEKVVFAVNCGGEEFEDSNGIVWVKDLGYFNAGTSSDYGLQYDIKLTKDQDLYQTERWHSDSFVYSVPVNDPGNYVLVLKFSEVYFQKEGEKVFDVVIGKIKVIKDLDVFGLVGKASAHDEFIEFELTAANKILIKGEEAEGAYDKKNKQLRIKFAKGRADNPKINAIAVVKGGLMDTDYAEKKKLLDEAKKKMLMKLKKHVLLKKRHDVDEEFNEDLENIEDDEIFKHGEKTIFYIFTTAPGTLILISFVIFIFLYIAIDNFDGHKKKKHS